jgi:hypothetical protein
MDILSALLQVQSDANYPDNFTVRYYDLKKALELVAAGQQQPPAQP